VNLFFRKLIVKDGCIVWNARSTLVISNPYRLATIHQGYRQTDNGSERIHHLTDPKSARPAADWDNVRRVPQISSKSVVHFWESYCRTREHHQNEP